MTTEPVKTLYDTFVEKYLQKLSTHSVPTNVSCAIHIGEIRGTMKGCALKVINKCQSDKKLSFKLLVESFLETISLLPEKEKKQIAKEVGINLTDSSASELEARCIASAAVSEIVNIQTFNVGVCSAPLGKHILLQIINSGSVEANCGLEIIMNSLVKRGSFVSIDNTLFLGNSWIMFGVFIICLVLIILACTLKRRIGLSYNYGYKLYV